MGKSTISMVIFNSYVSHYQRVPSTPGMLNPHCFVEGVDTTAVSESDTHWSTMNSSFQPGFAPKLMVGIPESKAIDGEFDLPASTNWWEWDRQILVVFHLQPPNCLNHSIMFYPNKSLAAKPANLRLVLLLFWGGLETMRRSFHKATWRSYGMWAWFLSDG